MDPIIVAAIISSFGALASALVFVSIARSRLELEKKMNFPLSMAFKTKGNSALTPNIFDLEYKSEKKGLIELYRKTPSEQMLNKDSKKLLFHQKAQDYHKKADSLWNSSIRADRYRSALFYVLAAETSILCDEFSRAGDFYHYAGMIWRTLEEWEKSGGYYYLSARCHRIINTDLELKKARRSLTRAMASYYAGLNYDGYELAKVEYNEVINTLKTKCGWSFSPEQLEDFEQLLEMRS